MSRGISTRRVVRPGLVVFLCATPRGTLVTVWACHMEYILRPKKVKHKVGLTPAGPAFGAAEIKRNVEDISHLLE